MGLFTKVHVIYIGLEGLEEISFKMLLANLRLTLSGV